MTLSDSKNFQDPEVEIFKNPAIVALLQYCWEAFVGRWPLGSRRFSRFRGWLSFVRGERDLDDDMRWMNTSTLQQVTENGGFWRLKGGDGGDL